MTPEVHAALDAVPATINTVSTWPLDRVLKEAEQAADVIASGAEVMWARRPIREMPPERFTGALTTGLAILAHRVGGVSLAGLHWCQAGHPSCPGPGAYAWPDLDDGMRRSAVYTPRLLAEEVAVGALEALVYQPGPLQTADRDTWQPITAGALLNLKICDIAVGAGVFLLAACRYLAARLQEAWQAEGRLAAKQAALDPIPVEQLARVEVLERCLYGVDIHPASIELATLACGLLAPLFPLTLRLRVGDSLLGITSLDQLRWMHIDPHGGRGLHKDVPPLDTTPIEAACCQEPDQAVLR